MTDTTTSTARPTSDEPSHYNVVAISFGDDHSAYGAFTKLNELDGQGQLGVQEAMLVQRAADGAMTVKDRTGTPEFVGTASGGLLGLLLGVIGGPIGVLVGGYTGLLVGSLYDLDDAEQVETTLGAISKSVQPDRTAVLAVVTEQSAEVVDAAMESFGGTVFRRPVADVEAEVAAATKAERKAAREAQRELMRSKREQTKESAHAKVEELKAKLAHHNGERAASKAAETAS